MDLLRLQKALLMCRMAANGTFLVNKEEPNYSTKLEHIDELIERLFDEEGRKVIVFSEYRSFPAASVSRKWRAWQWSGDATSTASMSFMSSRRR